MCVVSMIGDHYTEKFKQWPGYYDNYKTWSNNVSREEFELLRNEVLEMKKLLEKAIQYDIDNNEPHCETDEKVALLKKISEAVGVKIDVI